MKRSKYKALLCNGFTHAVLSIIVSVVWTWLTNERVIKFTCINIKKKKAAEGFNSIIKNFNALF